MKNNTSESRMLLEKALKILPFDNVLQNTRFHLRCALNDIQRIESKRQKREVVQKEAEKFFVPPENAKAVLNVVDQMIAEEQEKIDKLKNKPAPMEDLTD